MKLKTEMRKPNHVRLRGAIVALVMLVVACSSPTQTPEPAAAQVATSTPAQPTTTSAATTTTTRTPIAFTGANTFNVGSLGGLRLSLPDDVDSYAEADLVSLRTDAAPGSEVVITRIFQAGIKENPSIGDVLELLEDRFEVTITESDETLEFVEAELVRYNVRGAAALGNPALFSAQRSPLISIYQWSPLPNANLFLAEVEGGVLALAAIGDTVAAAENATDLARVVVQDATFISDETAYYFPAFGARGTQAVLEAPKFSQPDANPTGPPVLSAEFAPIEPGPYQTVHTVHQLEMDIPEGWEVTLNHPGLVVLTDGTARGPGDFVVAALSGPYEIFGVRFSGIFGGEATPIDEIDALLTAEAGRNPNLLVRDIRQDEPLGGLTTTRFDAKVRPEAACVPDSPCEFGIRGVGVFPNTSETEIRPGNAYRIWWIDQPGALPLLISASAPAASAAGWFDATLSEFLESWKFRPES